MSRWKRRIKDENLCSFNHSNIKSINIIIQEILPKSISVLVYTDSFFSPLDSVGNKKRCIDFISYSVIGQKSNLPLVLEMIEYVGTIL